MTDGIAAADVLALPWIQAIQPVRGPYLRRLSGHSGLEVWHVDVEFPKWHIPADKDRLWSSDKDANVRDTWKKRPLVRTADNQCPYVCGEIELVRRLRAAGLSSQWISEWCGFAHVPCWKDACVKRNELRERSPNVAAFDHVLRQRSMHSHPDLGNTGGHPDVAAWQTRSTEIVFLEYKGPGDTMKPKQNLWAQAVLALETDRLPYVAVMGSFVD